MNPNINLSLVNWIKNYSEKALKSTQRLLWPGFVQKKGYKKKISKACYWKTQFEPSKNEKFKLSSTWFKSNWKLVYREIRRNLKRFIPAGPEIISAYFSKIKVSGKLHFACDQKFKSNPKTNQIGILIMLMTKNSFQGLQFSLNLKFPVWNLLIQTIKTFTKSPNHN